MSRYLILLVLIFVNSCATLQTIKKPKLEVYLTNSAKFRLIEDDFVDENITLNQQLKGEFVDPTSEDQQKHKFRLNTVTELSKKRIKITALTTFGNRLVTIDYANQGINLWHSSFIDGEKVRPEYIIADLQLIYLPLAEIKNNISGDLIAEERETKDGLERLFSSNKETIIKITYGKKDKFNSQINLQNFLRNYQYSIK